MNKSKIDKFIDWIKQPSSVKAIVMFLSLAGVAITPERAEEIIYSGAVLYAGIAAFWDQG